MADTPFPPLKREPLLEEELPAANPTVRLIKGARHQIRAGAADRIASSSDLDCRRGDGGKLSSSAGRQAGSAAQDRRQLLRAGRAHDSQVRQRVDERAAEIVCFYLADTTERPPIEMLAGGMDSQLGKDAAQSILRLRSNRYRHCATRSSKRNPGERTRPATPGSPRRFAPRDDDSIRAQHALGYRLDWMWLRSTG